MLIFIVFVECIVISFKVELYIYIEGLFEFELMFVLVECNGVKLLYVFVEEVCVVYVFDDL